MSLCVLQFPDAAGYVGFANLPNQVHRKSVKKGFEFTLMVVGGWPLIDFSFCCCLDWFTIDSMDA